MSKRKYYVRRYGYCKRDTELWYVEPDMPFEIPEDWERITRKEAVRMASHTSYLQRRGGELAPIARKSSAEVAPAMVHLPGKNGKSYWKHWDYDICYEFKLYLRDHIIEVC